MSTGTFTRTDDILFAPIGGWRPLCQKIVRYIEGNRNVKRMHLPLIRLRPPDALLLEAFAEAYHVRGQTEFWRIEHPYVIIPVRFEFDGDILETRDGIQFPAYGEVGSAYYRSIEDVNLVPNTYTHNYIFGSYMDAVQGVSFLSFNYP